MLRIIATKIDQELQNILGRNVFALERPELNIVRKIISDIQKSGDTALLKYTRQFDSPKIKQLKVDPLEIELAHSQTDVKIIRALRVAIKNISNYHLRQLPKSWVLPAGNDSAVGMRFSPVESAGIYVPGGRAVYPSSVLMNAIPAKVAGVERIVLVSPPGAAGKIHSGILAAAKELGITEVYCCGGAQAIAALALGTKLIPRVDLIVGPGNIYVTLAKKLLYGQVGIDKLAGPSDSLILADDSAKVEFVAADLITQAEHDPLASSLLICDSKQFAEQVNQAVAKQCENLPRKKIILSALKNYGAILVIKNRADYVRLTDMIAPEHLQIMLKDQKEILDKINNAGAIFLGNYSPESLGDYLAGPNHVLPTGGTARFASPLSVDDFVKKSSLIQYTKEDLAQVRQDIEALATLEGLDAHAAAVRIRFEA